MLHPELLRTKLFIPASKSSIQRIHLFRLLDKGIQNRLTLLTAPAGFGKSSLVTDWIQWTKAAETPESNLSFVPLWLSLDEQDSDPRRFMKYFIAALQSPEGSLGQGIFSALENTEDINMENIMTILINELINLPFHIVLVLDDYHLIESPEIDQALSFFLDYLPPNMHLIVSSRINPSFNLSRLRARGQITEIRAAQLKFSHAEITEFIKQTTEIELSENQVKALETRTEGWVAGLQLAALSMKDNKDLDLFLKTFSGSNRFIIDYLGDEVLSSQPEEILDFLLKTSILSGLSALLCNALTEKSNGEEMLNLLEQRNLFIIALDDERRWFRYHHLFTDLLKRRLKSSNHALIPKLHYKAGVWHLAQGDFSEAFRHFIQSDNPAKAVEALEKRWQIYINQGQAGELRKMMDSLDPADIENSAPLSMAQCWLCCYQERFDKIAIHLENIYRNLDSAPLKGQDDMPMKLAVLPTQAEIMEAVVSFENKDFEKMKSHAQRAISLIPKEAHRNIQGMLYSAASYWLALAHEQLEETGQACALHLELINIMKESGNLMGAANSLLEISRIYLKAGRIKELIKLCEEMLAFMSQRGWQKLPPRGVPLLILAKVMRLNGSTEKAEIFFKQGLELIRPIMGPRFKDLVQLEDPGHKQSASNSLLIEPLSLRELEVLKLLTQGLSNNEICEKLFLALSTVKGHNRIIFDKLQVKSRTEAAARARELGLIQ